MSQSWTNAAPVKPKTLLIRKIQSGYTRPNAAGSNKIRINSELKNRFQKIFICQVLIDTEEIAEVAKGHALIEVLLTQSQSAQSMKTDNFKIQSILFNNLQI